jgi:putative transposase
MLATCRVGRLMRLGGIKPVRTRKHKVTTNSNHSLGIVANVLDGNFTADAPNRKWAGDISYIWTAQGWLYLAVILDLHSRRVVGWAVSDRMKKDLAIPKHWIWRYACAIRQRAASFTRIAAAVKSMQTA